MSTEMLIAAGVAAAVILGMAVALALLWRRQTQQRELHRRLIEGLRAVQMAQQDYAAASEATLGHMRDGLQTLTTVCANLDMRLHAMRTPRPHRRRPGKVAARRDFDTAIELARAGRQPERVANAARLTQAESALVCAVHQQAESGAEGA